MDKDANLVVIELKRTEDGGHMELQAVRYAAMVSTMTFDKAVEVYTNYLEGLGSDLEARSSLLEFLDWAEPNDDLFNKDVRIVLVSAEFSKELTTAVLWLIDREIDIRCIRIKPYSHNGQLLVDVQPIIPLPEAAAYITGVREKSRKERIARESSKDLTKYNVTINSVTEEGLAKRQAILRIVKHLCVSGVTHGQRTSMVTGVLGIGAEDVNDGCRLAALGQAAQGPFYGRAVDTGPAGVGFAHDGQVDNAGAAASACV